MKKIIAMALSLAMLLTIVGCRSNTSNDSPNTSKNNTNVTQNDTADSEGVSGGSKVTGKEIGVIIAGLETYYSYGLSGMKWAIEASGNTIIERNSEGTPVKELQNVEDLISYGVDAILIETTDGGVGQQACKLANEAGIPIFLVDCSVNEGEGKPDGQVEVNQYEYGIMAANYIIDNDLSGDFVVIGGIAGLPGNEQQQAGFLETIANDPKSTMLGEILYANCDRMQGEEVMRDYLLMYDHIDFVYTINEEEAYGASLAIAEAGRSDEIKVISANGSPVGKEMLEKGTLEITIGMSPTENGILSVIKCLDYLDGNPQEVRTEMPLVVLTKANLDEYTFWELEYQAEKYTPILKEMGYFAE